MLNGFNFPLKKIHHQEKLVGYYKSGRLSFESVWKENSISYRTIAELTVWNERRKFGLKPPISHSLRHRPQRFYWRYLWKLLSRESTLSYGRLIFTFQWFSSARKILHFSPQNAPQWLTRWWYYPQQFLYAALTIMWDKRRLWILFIWSTGSSPNRTFITLVMIIF